MANRSPRTEGSADRGTVSDEFGWAGSVGTRLYVGTNSYKGFAEFQGVFQDGAKPEWLINGGGEARLLSAFWLTLSAGVERNGQTGATDLRTQFGLRLAVPSG